MAEKLNKVALFIMLLAAIGILAISFTMTPVLATNQTNGTQNLTVGCTVAISLPDNSSNGGNGSQTQEALDNSYNSTVYSSAFSTGGPLANLYWTPTTPANDYMVVRNQGNNYLEIDVSLFSNSGFGGEFSVNANNGKDFGLDTSVSCLDGLHYEFAPLGVDDGFTACTALDYVPTANDLVINDRWVLNQEPPGTYTFVLGITAIENQCGGTIPIANMATAFASISSGGDNVFALDDYGSDLTFISPTTASYLTSGGVISFHDIDGSYYSYPAVFVFGIENNAAPDLWTPLFDLLANTWTPDTSAVILPNWTTGDVKWAITSDSSVSEYYGNVYIIVQAAGGSWWMYTYDQIDPTLNTANLVSRTAITGATPTAVNGFGYDKLFFVGKISYTAGGVNYIADIDLSTAAISNELPTEVTLKGLGVNNVGYVTGLAASGANAALVQESKTPYGPSNDRVGVVAVAIPFAGTPLGYGNLGGG